MKTKLYIKTAFVALVYAASLSSCLKDDKHYVDFASSVPLVELPSATGVGSKGGLFQSNALDNGASIPVNLQVNIAAPKTLSTATTVKVSLDVPAFTAYNAANGNKYQLLPASFYTSSFTTTIPANQNSSNIVINVNSSLIDPAITNYVLPLTITDGGGQQISNYKTVLLNIQAKNIYDGIYHASGTFVRVGIDQRTINVDKDISTIDATTVLSYAADLGTGSPINLKVNADNTVTVTFVGDSLTGLPAPYTQVGVNKYDPATKTFTLHYQYRGGARTTEETLVYKGKRP